MPRLILTLGLMGCVGCAGNRLASHAALPRSPVGAVAVVSQADHGVSEESRVVGPAESQSNAPAAEPKLIALPVGHKVLAAHRTSAEEPLSAGALTIDDHELPMHLVPSPPNEVDVVSADHSPVAFHGGGTPAAPLQATTPISMPAGDDARADGESFTTDPTNLFPSENLVDLNLPSALARIDGQHPAVGIAQWRVQEAYAQFARAEVLWLPSIQAGFSFHRHDGNYQASDGSIIDVNRNSFQYGLGTGGTGAGTTPRPGLVAQFHLADAIFQPEIAQKTAWARGHAAKAVVNEQLLNAAITYIDLLDAHQDARILQESRTRTANLSKITSDFAQAGQGLQADADRLKTELTLADGRLVGAREQIAIASARLAQALSMDAGNQIRPMDVTIVPLEMTSSELDRPSLISTGLSTRPELKESQALVAAACEAYRREKYAPLVPSVLLGFSTGGFGGGLGDELDNVDSRYDLDALMSWEVRNFGLGERAARRESSARVQQAQFAKLRVMDQVAREVSEAHAQVQFRRQRMSITQRAITSAQNSYDLNLARIRDGQGLPLEVLQSAEALERAQRAYLRAVVDYNQAQFRLQWALGWPVATLSDPPASL